MGRSAVQPARKGPSKPSHTSSVAIRESTYVSVRPKSKRSVAWGQIFNILRRLASIAAAVRYVVIAMSGTWWALVVLSSTRYPTEVLRVFPSSLIQGYLGEGLIRDSPLVLEQLGGDTTPRDFALFLESATKTSTEKCTMEPLFDSAMYNYEFLSDRYAGIVADTKYNVTVLDDLELVLAVVDCTFQQLQLGDQSALRVFYLVRSRADPTDLYLVTMSFNVQEYIVSDWRKKGPALVCTLTLIQDIRADSVEAFYMVALTYPYERVPFFEVYEFVGIASGSRLVLRNIPQDPTKRPANNLLTARKRGFCDSESQCNVRIMYTILDGQDAKTSLTQWEWIGQTVMMDSWAWVHCIHFFFGLQTIYSLVVLLLVTYQKIRMGKVWIGDPFASVSTPSLVARGILVLISSFVNDFWSVNEYAMSKASYFTESQPVRIHDKTMHADLVTVYLSLVGFVSSIFRERIDPSIAIFLFEIDFIYGRGAIRASSAVMEKVITYSKMQWKLGIAKVTPVVATMSPMRLTSSFQLSQRDPAFILATFFSLVYLMSLISFIAILRKVYKRCYPDKVHSRSGRSTDTSKNENTAMTKRNIITNFELSTGAELQSRYGLVSDYNNYVYFKGMKFASPDGVYCSGYVIVNGKFLVSSNKLFVIVMIKLLRIRLAKVYAYEVDGNTVKETARLVYPNTFMWSDLWRLDVTVLL